MSQIYRYIFKKRRTCLGTGRLQEWTIFVLYHTTQQTIFCIFRLLELETDQYQCSGSFACSLTSNSAN